MKWVSGLSILMVSTWVQGFAQVVNPFPREVVRTERVIEWTFRGGAAAWSATHDCTAVAEKGVLRIRSTGNDPYLASPSFKLEGPLVAKMRVKCATAGSGQISG